MNDVFPKSIQRRIFTVRHTKAGEAEIIQRVFELLSLLAPT